MSVYYEAISSGRIRQDHVTSKPPKPGYAPRSVWYGGISRVLRAVKREEAEERNAATQFQRTRGYRRALAADLAAAAKRRADR